MNFQKLTRYLDSLTEQGVPGVDCTVYHNHREIYRLKIGYKNIEKNIPMDTGMLYNMYSVSKVITCTAALQLYEKGLYSLSDPLWHYIPEYKEMHIETEDGRKNASKPITIRNLFTMTAGLHYNIRCKSILQEKKETNGACPTLDIVRALAQEPLSFEPGARWQYSFCHDVLGGLIEILSGKTLDQYCREHIFIPLGMRRSSFYLPPEEEANIAPMYIYNPETKRGEKASNHNVFRLGSHYEGGGATFVSSVDDCARFADALACSGRTKEGNLLLSKGTIELMRTNQLGSEQLQSFDWPHMIGYGYGLGVRTMMDRQKCGSVGSVGEFGWGGAAGAYMMIDPELSLSAFCGQHMMNSPNETIHPNLRNLIYEGFYTN